MNIALLIIGIILFLLGSGYLIYLTRLFIKDPVDKKGTQRFYLRYGGSVLSLTIGFLLLALSLFLFHSEWQEKSVYTSGVYAGESISFASNLALSLVGSFLFASAMALLWSIFALRYYKRAFDEKVRKKLSLLMFLAIPIAIAGFFLLFEGIGPYLKYPLISGFAIGENGFHWMRAGGASSGLHVAWYGIVILFGVAVSYWVSDHRFYQKYHKHGYLDAVVLFGFPAGIIGARIWYVVGNFEREFAGQSWTKVFEIWNGGLTILGGAFLGIVVGYLVLRLRHRDVDWRWAIDTILPTILLAQAIGRWGNFFNVEVYGDVIKLEGIWRLLPNWIAQQMGYSSGGISLATGYIHVPLYLVEGLLNIGGYFLLAYGLRKGLKKVLVPGDIAASYFLWYGIVRLILEPLRDNKFNMGVDNAWSICNAIVYILIGAVLIIGFHLYDFYQKKEKPLPLLLGAIIFLIPTFFFPLLNSLNVASSKDGSGVTSSYTGFEVIAKSPFHLVTYLLIAIAFISLCLSLLFYLLKKKYFHYFLYGGSALSLLGALFLLLGKKASGIETASTYLTLSYGYVLMALFALGSTLMGATYFFALRNKAKQSNINSENSVEVSSEGEKE